MKTGRIPAETAYYSLERGDSSVPVVPRRGGRADEYPSEFCEFTILTMNVLNQAHQALIKKYLPRSDLQQVVKSALSFDDQVIEALCADKKPQPIYYLRDLVDIYRRIAYSLIEQDFRDLAGTSAHSVLKDQQGRTVFSIEKLNVHRRGRKGAPPGADLSERPFTRVQHGASLWRQQFKRDPDTGEISGPAEVYRPDVQNITWFWDSAEARELSFRFVRDRIAAWGSNLSPRIRLLLKIFDVVIEDGSLLRRTAAGWVFRVVAIAARLNCNPTEVTNALRPITRGQNELSKYTGMRSLPELEDHVSEVVLRDRNPLADLGTGGE